MSACLFDMLWILYIFPGMKKSDTHILPPKKKLSLRTLTSKHVLFSSSFFQLAVFELSKVEKVVPIVAICLPV